MLSRASVTVACLCLTSAGCASRAVEAGGSEATRLPDGTGAAPAIAGGMLLEQRCSVCHELAEVTKFAGYYGEAQWSAVISTMVNYGAQLSPTERPVLLHYLTDDLGRDGD
jgi:cytochrome c5